MRATWLAVAAVLVIGLILFAPSTRPVPAGFMIDIATAPEHCGDGRYVMLSAVGNHRITLNRALTFLPIATTFPAFVAARLDRMVSGTPALRAVVSAVEIQRHRELEILARLPTVAHGF